MAEIGNVQLNTEGIQNLVAQNFDWENATWDVVDTYFKQDNVLIPLPFISA